MAGGRVLAARGLDSITPLAARLAEREAWRRTTGRSLHRLAKAQRLEARQPQRSAPQALAVAQPFGASYGDMAKRVRALVAVCLRVLSAAAPDRVEDDQNRAGHGRVTG